MTGFIAFMDEVLKQAGTQAPSLVVLVVVVYFFLGAQKNQRESAVNERKELVDQLRSFHADHLEARKESREALNRVSDAIHQISIAISNCPLKGNR